MSADVDHQEIERRVDQAVAIAELRTEVGALRDEVGELKDNIRELVDAWKTANGVVRFIKALGVIAGAGAAILGLIKLALLGAPPSK